MNADPLAVSAVIEFAARLGLGKAEDIEMSPLLGGVSSDVWLVRGPLGSACIKQALPTLRVAQRWDAPIQRGAYEARWLVTASTIVPCSVPRMLGYEPRNYLIGMEYFIPADFPNWRSEMMAGKVDPLVAESLGHMLGEIHAATANRQEIADRFDSDTLFDALRLDPYFRSLHAAHADLIERLDEIIQNTATTRRVLVHGDVSPKNVLVGRSRAILLDAECAWFGDPAFDVAFLCTHLLLKRLILPEKLVALDACFTKYLAAYESHVNWEPIEQLWSRSAALLSAMLLARIDGKSPVDYLSDVDRNWVRVFACDMLRQSPLSPGDVRLAWHLAKGDSALIDASRS